MALGTASDQFGPALLSLLFNLAGKPLESTPVWLELQMKAAVAAHGDEQHAGRDAQVKQRTPPPKQPGEAAAAGGSEPGHDSSAQDTASEASSTLSDWSGDEEGEQAATDELAATAAAHASQVSLSPDGSGGDGPTTSLNAAQQAGVVGEGAGVMQRVQSQAADVPPSLLRCADPLPKHATPQPGDLVPRLVRCRLGRAAFGGPRAEHCLTDTYLVHQVRPARQHIALECAVVASLSCIMCVILVMQ
jgi:hypothetical protein